MMRKLPPIAVALVLASLDARRPQQTAHQRRFSEAVRDATGSAEKHGYDVAIIYDDATDSLATCQATIAREEYVQATITPTGKIIESRTINPKFCEV
jgi:hypothetical protein